MGRTVGPYAMVGQATVIRKTLRIKRCSYDVIGKPLAKVNIKEALWALLRG